MASLVPFPFCPNRFLLVAAMLACMPGVGFSLQDASHIPQVAILRPRAGMAIPNPPFSLRGLADIRKMPPGMVLQWQACLGRTLDPERSVTIKAVVITSSGKLGTAVEKTDERTDEFYEDQARLLASPTFRPTRAHKNVSPMFRTQCLRKY